MRLPLGLSPLIVCAYRHLVLLVHLVWLYSLLRRVRVLHTRVVRRALLPIVVALLELLIIAWISHVSPEVCRSINQLSTYSYSQTAVLIAVS